MALAETGRAIGAVTRLLQEHLDTKTGTDIGITVGRPEPGGASGVRLNLFLYEAMFDPNLKNVALDEDQPAPLWLVLKYLLTAFDEGGKSDTIEAHECLGEGIRALQELSCLPLTGVSPEILEALNDNPEPLKITFDETSCELLSKLMQGSDDNYRFSMSFQVRPVMIVTGEPPSYSLLVGVDYTKRDGEVIGEKGLQIPVISSLAPEITQVFPAKFELNETVIIQGDNLNLSDVAVCLGPAELPVIAQKPNQLKCLVDETLGSGRVISAGSYPLSVVQILPGGRRRSSNLLIAGLLPVVFDVTPNSLALDATSTNVFGNIVMTGVLLGSEQDDILVALYQDGTVIKIFDRFTASPTQSGLTLEMVESQAVPPGIYRVILRVNGQQAKKRPEVELVV